MRPCGVNLTTYTIIEIERDIVGDDLRQAAALLNVISPSLFSHQGTTG